MIIGLSVDPDISCQLILKTVLSNVVIVIKNDTELIRCLEAQCICVMLSLKPTERSQCAGP